MKSRLFVISPIGQKGTPQRKQADHILDFVKDVTRDSYDVIRGDEQPNARIADAILGIPFVFKDAEPVDPAFWGRAFLPLLTDYEFKENGLAFRVLYLEIPSKMRHDNDVLRVDASDYRDYLNGLNARSIGLSPHRESSGSPGARNGEGVSAGRHVLEEVPS